MTAPGRHQRHRRFRRLDHRRHGVDHQRRRPLARRTRPPAPRRSTATAFAVVNAGIGGNMVVGPADYNAKPFAGGPAATERLDRDVITLSGVKTVFWLEGINDFGKRQRQAEDVEAGCATSSSACARKFPACAFSWPPLTSSLNSTNGGYGAPSNDKRQALQPVHQDRRASSTACSTSTRPLSTRRPAS